MVRTKKRQSEATLKGSVVKSTSNLNPDEGVMKMHNKSDQRSRNLSPPGIESRDPFSDQENMIVERRFVSSEDRSVAAADITSPTSVSLKQMKGKGKQFRRGSESETTRKPVIVTLPKNISTPVSTKPRGLPKSKSTSSSSFKIADNDSISISSTSVTSISRKQVNGSTKVGKFIRTTSRSTRKSSEGWKSPTQRVNEQKKNSFTYIFTKAINGKKSGASSRRDSNSGSSTASSITINHSSNSGSGDDFKANDNADAHDLLGESNISSRKVSTTNGNKNIHESDLLDSMMKDHKSSSAAHSNPYLQFEIASADVVITDKRSKTANNNKQSLRIDKIENSARDHPPAPRSGRPATPYKRRVHSEAVGVIGNRTSIDSMTPNVPFDEELYTRKSLVRKSTNSEENCTTTQAQSQTMDALVDETSKSLEVTTISDNTACNDVEPESLSTSACNVALQIFGGIGSAIEYCMGENETSKIGTIHNTGSMDTYDSLETMDTATQQLIHEVHLLNRMNSWETNGTFNTMGTTNTLNTTTTTMTADQSLLSEMPTDIPATVLSDPDVDDDGNTIPKSALKAHKVRRLKRKKKSKRKAVNFQYPPISSMKACPRVTPEERKSLFFTEEELDIYEGDRQNNVCDDIEIVAVEFSDSDESSSAVSELGDSDEMRQQNKVKPALRVGKHSKDFFEKSLSNPSINSSESVKSSQKKQLKNSSTISQTLPTLTSSESVKGGYQYNQAKRPPARTKVNGSNDNSKSNSDGGKIKGVQIYLRQRSVKH